MAGELDYKERQNVPGKTGLFQAWLLRFILFEELDKGAEIGVA